MFLIVIGNLIWVVVFVVYCGVLVDVLCGICRLKIWSVFLVWFFVRICGLGMGCGLVRGVIVVFVDSVLVVFMVVRVF